MKERLNASLQSVSLIAVVGLAAWAVYSGDMNAPQVLTYLIIFITLIEVCSLYLVSKIYPESHTSFKIGMIATFLILLGIKRMLPDFFVPLTITAFAVNFLYNFYTYNKRKKGYLKRKTNKKLKL